MNDSASGSSVRPVKMLQAFKELGWEVDLVSGFSNLSNFKSRGSVLKKWIKKVKSGEKYDFCYIEPPAGPMFHPLDLKFMRIIKKQGIPMSLFYRDAYWCLADWFNLPDQKFKLWLIKVIQNHQWKKFQKYCDIIYMPSESFGAAMKPKCEMKVLPPAGALREGISEKPFGTRKIIYVGEYSKEAGMQILINAMDIVNKKIPVTLELCCRQAEFQASGDILSQDYINIHHVSGDELAKIYLDCDTAVVPRERDSYMDMALPVKIFEYLSFGLPIVSTDVTEIARFVNQNDCGIICKADAQSLADAILTIYSDEISYYALKRNAIDTLNKNLWIHRAEQIAEDFSR